METAPAATTSFGAIKMSSASTIVRPPAAMVAVRFVTLVLAAEAPLAVMLRLTALIWPAVEVSVTAPLGAVIVTSPPAFREPLPLRLPAIELPTRIDTLPATSTLLPAPPRRARPLASTTFRSPSVTFAERPATFV